MYRVAPFFDSHCRSSLAVGKTMNLKKVQKEIVLQINTTTTVLRHTVKKDFYVIYVTMGHELFVANGPDGTWT